MRHFFKAGFDIQVSIAVPPHVAAIKPTGILASSWTFRPKYQQTAENPSYWPRLPPMDSRS